MHTADVVIIGGGIVGASVAWHLTEAGCRNILIVERETHQGKGSTGKSMGGCRAQFATRPNIQMSLYSIPFYATFEKRLGHPSGYRAQGYLFVTTDPNLDKVAGDHDGWSGTDLTQDQGFRWVVIDVMPDDHYKFTNLVDYAADPWSRAYTYDNFGEMSLVAPTFVLQELYRSSASRVPLGGTWRHTKRSALIDAFWVVLVASVVSSADRSAFASLPSSSARSDCCCR